MKYLYHGLLLGYTTAACSPVKNGHAFFHKIKTRATVYSSPYSKHLFIGPFEKQRLLRLGCPNDIRVFLISSLLCTGVTYPHYGIRSKEPSEFLPRTGEEKSYGKFKK